MKRHLLTLLMALCSLFASAYDFEVDGIYYYINNYSNKTVSVVSGGYNHYEGEIKIPEVVTYNSENYTVVSIWAAAFCDCSNLTSIDIPNSVTEIGDNAFADCSKLASVTISNSVTEIGEGVFDGCISLTSIDIPNSVTKIGEDAFADCHRLTTVIIPNSVTYIDREAFYNCRRLTSVLVDNTNPYSISLGALCFYGCNIGSCSLYVPKESIPDYKEAPKWKDFGYFKPLSEYSSIEDISVDSGECGENCHKDIYSLQGVCLKRNASQEDIDALPAGLYIIGGKKVIVR